MIWLRRALAALALVAAPATAAEPWREASSAHFVIYSQESEADLRQYAERLERFDKALRLLQKMADEPVGPANRLTVFVAANSAAVQRLLGAPDSNVAGFYRGRAGASIAVTSREKTGSDRALSPQIVLLHEYAHYFMLRNFPAAYPAWFREGFAEFYSTARFQPDGSLIVGAPANHRVYELAAARDTLSLDRLLGDQGGKQAASMPEVYGYGWLLTHYLNFSDKRKGLAELRAYLEAINRGTPALAAAKTAFGDLDQLKREVQAYLGKRTMLVATIGADRLPVGPVAVRTLRPGEQAMLPVAIRSRLGVDEKKAKAVAVDARKVAGKFPDDAYVQTALAEAEFDTGAFDNADAAANRVLAVDPKAGRALLYKARVLLARAEAAKGDDKTALVKSARSYVMRANRLDPDDPEPLILFYTSYRTAEAKPTQNAVDGLLVAHRLGAEDESLRLLLAHQLAEEKRAAEVRILLAPVAYDPHGGKSAVAAQQLLATLPPIAAESPAPVSAM
ncbi:hypothetical protein [Sphingomonas jatrophae]|uniref:DUF1570 domain-containing protein n=1 Tax=Sphingomonas jatrophae TaxID=1166337 RepID=A0A1I6K3Z8_9SPHN|nr:hypothetical protein [Sphingomonas jatrophae]SFR85906.1 hypothetical protein SAMN05192580_1300 [Sphingomonas jatrophae]